MVHLGKSISWNPPQHTDSHPCTRLLIQGGPCIDGFYRILLGHFYWFLFGICWAIFTGHIYNRVFQNGDSNILLHGSFVRSHFAGLKSPRTWIFMIMGIIGHATDHHSWLWLLYVCRIIQNNARKPWRVFRPCFGEYKNRKHCNLWKRCVCFGKINMSKLDKQIWGISTFNIRDEWKHIWKLNCLENFTFSNGIVH